jgi:hypothetical protein
MLAFVGAANAAIVGVALGSGPRTDPLTLGPYSCPLLPPDTRPLGYFPVTDIPGVPPLTGNPTFSIALGHAKIGAGWATWSPGSPATWDKSMYWTQGAFSVTIGLPAQTAAFAFFAEPNPFQLHVITATADDGTTVTQTPHGSAGAMGYGFYGTGTTTIKSITVSSPTADFAIGEFYGIPEPTSLSLLALGGLALLRRR